MAQGTVLTLLCTRSCNRKDNIYGFIISKVSVGAADIIRFPKELQEFPWFLENLVFLDEARFDNKSMLKKRGYGLKGHKLIFVVDLYEKLGYLS